REMHYRQLIKLLECLVEKLQRITTMSCQPSILCLSQFALDTRQIRKIDIIDNAKRDQMPISHRLLNISAVSLNMSTDHIKILSSKLEPLLPVPFKKFRRTSDIHVDHVAMTLLLLKHFNL